MNEIKEAIDTILPYIKIISFLASVVLVCAIISLRNKVKKFGEKVEKTIDAWEEGKATKELAIAEGGKKEKKKKKRKKKEKKKNKKKPRRGGGEKKKKKKKKGKRREKKPPPKRNQKNFFFPFFPTSR